MTLAQLFANADSREIGLWAALYRLEYEEQSLRDLAARAETARKNRPK